MRFYQAMFLLPDHVAYHPAICPYRLPHRNVYIILRRQICHFSTPRSKHLRLNGLVFQNYSLNPISKSLHKHFRLAKSTCPSHAFFLLSIARCRWYLLNLIRKVQGKAISFLLHRGDFCNHYNEKALIEKEATGQSVCNLLAFSLISLLFLVKAHG